MKKLLRKMGWLSLRDNLVWGEILFDLAVIGLLAVAATGVYYV